MLESCFSKTKQALENKTKEIPQKKINNNCLAGRKETSFILC
jgi:hypothetical protein